MPPSGRQAFGFQPSEGRSWLRLVSFGSFEEALYIGTDAKFALAGALAMIVSEVYEPPNGTYLHLPCIAFPLTPL